MLKNDSFIKLDELDAQEIYGLGFISDLHPHLYNRINFKNFLIKKLKEQNENIKINVYVRNVWNHYEMSSCSKSYVKPPSPIYNPYNKQISRPTRHHPPTPVQPKLNPIIPHPDDSRWFGQKIHPNVSSCRFLLQNPNGLDTSDNCLEFGSILQDMKKYKIDMLLLSEVNINAHNYQLVDNLRSAASLHLNHGILNVTNTPLFPHSSYQPGGVLTATSNVLASRSASMKSDPAGRWTCNSFYGKKYFLKIYCFYRVCPLTENGVITAASQQQHFFLETSNTTVDPRKKAVDDILEELQKDVSQGNEIILRGDFNELLDGKEKTHVRLEQLGLTNILSHYVGELPRTKVRGKECIDHVYATHRASQAITSVGIAPFNFFLPSDHRAIFFDLNILDILDIDTNHFPPFLFRRLKSTSRSAVDAYQKTISLCPSQLDRPIRLPKRAPKRANLKLSKPPRLSSLIV